MRERPLQQGTIGILGGSSNVATAHYYRLINEIANARLGGWDIAETLTVGMNFGNIEALLRQDDWATLDTYIRGKLDQLIAGGADLIIGVSNTLHRSVEPAMAERATPFLHIVDPTGAAINASGCKRVALFGTAPVMRGDYIKGRYEQQFGLEIVTPNIAEQQEIDRIIFDELVKDVVRPESRERYVEIARRMARDERIEGVILGCTEIFLLLEPADCPELHLFNTTRLHCEAAVRMASELSANRH